MSLTVFKCTDGAKGVNRDDVLYASHLLQDMKAVAEDELEVVDLRGHGVTTQAVEDFVHLTETILHLEQRRRQTKKDITVVQDVELPWPRIVDAFDLAERLHATDEWRTAFFASDVDRKLLVRIRPPADQRCCGTDTLVRLLELASVAPWLGGTGIVKTAVLFQDPVVEGDVATLCDAGLRAVQACHEVHHPGASVLESFADVENVALLLFATEPFAVPATEYLLRRATDQMRGGTLDCFGLQVHSKVADAALAACIRHGGDAALAEEFLVAMDACGSRSALPCLPRAVEACLRADEGGAASRLAPLFGCRALVAAAMNSPALLPRALGFVRAESAESRAAELTSSWIARAVLNGQVLRDNGCAPGLLDCVDALLELVPTDEWVAALQEASSASVGNRIMIVPGRTVSILRKMYDAPGFLGDVVAEWVGKQIAEHRNRLPSLGDFNDADGSIAELLLYMARTSLTTSRNWPLVLGLCAFRLGSSRLLAAAGDLASVDEDEKKSTRRKMRRHQV